MDDLINTIHRGDCIKEMNVLPAGSVDLVFADPPFNIGYEYDEYEDAKEHQQYIDWSAQWIYAVHRILRANGTFWLAIGDDYAAELKLESQKLGFFCRSWVVWYYTFGVNCTKKFTRSHTHLFHFVKDLENFTFREEDLENRVPSARELVYNDKRANPKGRLPDDTWIIQPADAIDEHIDYEDGSLSSLNVEFADDENDTYTLRPQDLEQSFRSTENTWYFPRVAGTFKERAGFHGCQMPEQLLGRIIRTCSNSDDLILDPFSGSATTLAVAKKLGRRFIGFDISDRYVKFGRQRLRGVRLGDRLDGSPEPTKSAPRTEDKRGRKRLKRSRSTNSLQADLSLREQHYSEILREKTELGVIEAFRRTHDGFSTDRVVTDLDLNREFLDTCQKMGLAGDARTWNWLLFRLRKRKKLSDIPTLKRTSISWEKCDQYMFASEIAWQIMIENGTAHSLDEILCDPILAEKFVRIAIRFAPGFTSLEYKWAALKIRKEAKYARSRATVLTAPSRFSKMLRIDELNVRRLPDEPGLYVLSENQRRTRNLYVGETLDLRSRLTLTLKRAQIKEWLGFSESVFIQTLQMDHSTAGRLAWQSCLVEKFKPRLNSFELRSAS